MVNKDFAFHDGLFSGFDKGKRAYDPATWSYEVDAEKKPVTDPTLTNPRCVFQLMKNFYSRYTPEMVTAITGVPKEQLLEMAAIYGATGQPGKAGALLYAMGGTQHTTGVQIIRGYTILQQLLGNMGMPGGGINALRGENNVQGSTDMGLLFNTVPGVHGHSQRSGAPDAEGLPGQRDPQGQLLDQQTQVLRQYVEGLLGEAATPENQFAYDYLPKIGKGYQGSGYSWIPLFESMGEGGIKGMLVWGMNPAVSAPNLTQAYERPGQAGVAGGLRPLGDRHLGLLETARGQDQGHQDRGLSLPGGGLHGEGRQRQQQRPLDPVALPGGEAPRRRPERPVVRQPAGAGAEEAL